MKIPLLLWVCIGWVIGGAGGTGKDEVGSKGIGVKAGIEFAGVREDGQGLLGKGKGEA